MRPSSWLPDVLATTSEETLQRCALTCVRTRLGDGRGSVLANVVGSSGMLCSGRRGHHGLCSGSWCPLCRRRKGVAVAPPRLSGMTTTTSTTSKTSLERFYEALQTKEQRAAMPDLPEREVRRLARDKYWSVRAAVAKRPDLPLDIVERLANDQDEHVRTEVARRPDVPKDSLESLARDFSDLVCDAVALRSDLPPHLWLPLARGKGAYVLARRSPMVLPWEVLEWLVMSSSPAVRAAVALRPEMPADLVGRLVEDEDARVRAVVAYRPDLPAEFVARLAEDEDEQVRVAVKRRSNLSVDLVGRLASW